MLRDYEILYIIDPDIPEDAVTGLIERFKQLATDQRAEIEKVIRWDKRRLAYEVKGKREGIYVDMHLRSDTSGIAEIERLLKITDGILRHLTVRKDKKHASDFVPEPPPPAPEPRAEEPTLEELAPEAAPEAPAGEAAAPAAEAAEQPAAPPAEAEAPEPAAEPAPAAEAPAPTEEPLPAS